jgi:perosamine synthetase
MTERDLVPLARPELGATEEELVLEVVRSGRLSLGPMLDRFESELADWLGVDDAVAVSSGTAALHLGVRLKGWGPGDEVITTPLSFVATANSLLYEGATPIFCDIDSATLNLDPAAVSERVGERTVGILPVHIFGYPAASSELEALASSHGLGLLEDGCQALGAVDGDGRRVGSRANSCAFAFYANKQLTTGEGGALIPNNADAAALLRSERNQGRAPDMAALDHDRLGFNYRMSELNAALGVAQIQHLDAMLAARERVAAGYAELLAGIEGLELPLADRAPERRSWFVYVVQLPPQVDRGAAIAALEKSGVQAKAYLPCIHLYPHYQERFGFTGGEFPVAERFAERALALPFFPAMTEAEQERVAAALAAALGRPAPA